MYSVYLHSNKIRSINFNADRFLSKNSDKKRRNTQFIVIWIENNPIMCDCKIYNFTRFLERKYWLTPVAFSVYGACQGPVNMNGIEVADVELEDLVCENVNTTSETVCPYPCSCSFWPHMNADLVDCSNRNLTVAPDQLFPSEANVSIDLNLTGNRLTRLPKIDQPNYHLVKELYASDNQIENIEQENIISNLEVFIYFFYYLSMQFF